MKYPIIMADNNNIDDDNDKNDSNGSKYKYNNYSNTSNKLFLRALSVLTSVPPWEV